MLEVIFMSFLLLFFGFFFFQLLKFDGDKNKKENNKNEVTSDLLGDNYQWLIANCLHFA